MMFDAFGGGGVSETIKVLLSSVDSVQCNTRQRRNDKQRKLIDVGSIHWNMGEERQEQILKVGVDFN